MQLKNWIPLLAFWCVRIYNIYDVSMAWWITLIGLNFKLHALSGCNVLLQNHFPHFADYIPRWGMGPKWNGKYAMPGVGCPSYVISWKWCLDPLEWLKHIPAYADVIFYLYTPEQVRIILLLWLCQTLFWWVALSTVVSSSILHGIRVYLHEYTLYQWLLAIGWSHKYHYLLWEFYCTIVLACKHSGCMTGNTVNTSVWGYLISCRFHVACLHALQ